MVSSSVDAVCGAALCCDSIHSEIGYYPMKNRINNTISDLAYSLLKDHERYGFASQSSMIEAAIERIVDPIRNTPDMQRVYEEMEQRLKSQLLEDLRIRVYNEVREFWQILEDEKNQPPEGIDDEG